MLTLVYAVLEIRVGLLGFLPRLCAVHPIHGNESFANSRRNVPVLRGGAIWCTLYT
jgi:hypothetical protein